MPARRAASVTARYMAPVSRNWKPRRRARALAALLFPAPAGPSMVIIMACPSSRPAVEVVERKRRNFRGTRQGEAGKKSWRAGELLGRGLQTTPQQFLLADSL